VEILILGVNGFIGSHLTEAILEHTDWRVHGMDLESDRLERWLAHPRFRFLEGDISINHEWVEYHVKRSDVCLPLVAIATPATYVKDPLAVFELDFEQNLRIVRQCQQYQTRVVFPSTSEVYGMCPDEEFDEETSTLVYGPVSKSRWIYACSKQLLDRVIAAAGRDRGLQYTLFRPFNWIGPGLDSIHTPKEGSSRVMTQFLGHLLRGEPITLVDGGRQRRCFTHVGDGIDALMRILRNENGAADGQIFNIGNPAGDRSIRELADTMVRVLASFPGHADVARTARIVEQSAEQYYGKEYQDIVHRVPSIRRANELLGWTPKVEFEDAVRRTIAHYVNTATVPDQRRSHTGSPRRPKPVVRAL
jgi:nucleoside-diphosphate-sugar epimerase